jgi:uncharacterized protein YcbX
MWLGEIWRYPVKSMGGERLEAAELGAGGLPGDRVVLVRSPHGRVVTSRGRPRLLGHHATLGDDGEPRVDGRRWSDPMVARDVEEAAGPGAKLVRFEGLERFDILPLLVATDGAIAAFGRDSRRLRPNLIIGGVDGLAERDWEGRRLRMGSALIGLESLRERCIMTTYDPDTLVQDREVLLDIHRRFGGKLALNAFVIESGRIAVGDPVEMV